MPRLGPQKRRNLAKALRENGLEEHPDRGKGSHTFWVHPDDPTRETTVPGDETIKKGTAATIISQAGKTLDEYFAHL